jgi:hypothetical protein
MTLGTYRLEDGQESAWQMLVLDPAHDRTRAVSVALRAAARRQGVPVGVYTAVNRGQEDLYLVVAADPDAIMRMSVSHEGLTGLQKVR